MIFIHLSRSLRLIHHFYPPKPKAKAGHHSSFSMKHIFQNSRALNVAISILAAIAFWQTMNFAYGELPWSVFRVFGGDGVGFLKFLAYAAFIFGWLELRERQRAVRREESGFHFNLLPTQDQMVLSAQDVQDIKLEVLSLEKKGHAYLVPDLIKKTATQYRNDNDISDTMQALDAHLSTSKEQHEGELELVRYIIQSIPMLGFIGTIIELTNALKSIAKAGGLELVRDAMSSAFDATLVALALTILLTYFYHAHIGQMDGFFARTKGYIMDNLIGRIYTR